MFVCPQLNPSKLVRLSTTELVKTCSSVHDLASETLLIHHSLCHGSFACPSSNLSSLVRSSSLNSSIPFVRSLVTQLVKHFIRSSTTDTVKLCPSATRYVKPSTWPFVGLSATTCRPCGSSVRPPLNLCNSLSSPVDVLRFV